MELILDIIDIPNVPEGSPVSDILIKAAVGVPLAGCSSILQMSTEALHWKCPITPDWAPALDAICNVEEAVDWQGANWKAI